MGEIVVIQAILSSNFQSLFIWYNEQFVLLVWSFYWEVESVISVYASC